MRNQRKMQFCIIMQIIEKYKIKPREKNPPRILITQQEKKIMENVRSIRMENCVCWQRRGKYFKFGTNCKKILTPAIFILLSGIWYKGKMER